jgi:hypothetical protein
LLPLPPQQQQQQTGDCKLSDGPAATAKFLNAVHAKNEADASFRWSSDATYTANGNYYGPMLWAGAW